MSTEQLSMSMFATGADYDAAVLVRRVADLEAERDALRARLAEIEARPVPAIPDGWRLVKSGALAMVVNALRRDAEDGRPVRGEMADELLAAAPEAAR
jgi:hypothetical protein